MIPQPYPCSKCEYECECFFLLKLWQFLTGQCRQGRKRKVMRQATITEVIEGIENPRGVPG